MADDANTLEKRVQESLRSLRDHFTGLESEAHEIKDAFQQLQSRVTLSYQVRRHPLLALGLALGGGLLLARNVKLRRQQTMREKITRTLQAPPPPPLSSLRQGFMHAFLRSSGERFGQQALGVLAGGRPAWRRPFRQALRQEGIAPKRG